MEAIDLTTGSMHSAIPCSGFSDSSPIEVDVAAKVNSTNGIAITLELYTTMNRICVL